MDDIQGIGKRLKDLRMEKDLSLDLIAYDMSKRYDIEITKGHLSRWENGKNVPSLRLAKQTEKTVENRLKAY